jgi:hypothetical protein
MIVFFLGCRLRGEGLESTAEIDMMTYAGHEAISKAVNARAFRQRRERPISERTGVPRLPTVKPGRIGDATLVRADQLRASPQKSRAERSGASIAG